MVEQKVREVLCFASHQTVFPAQQGKTAASFQKEPLNAVHEGVFCFSFMILPADGDKIEDIRVVYHFPGKIALWHRQQCRLKGCHCVSRPFI